ncbi:hypothetical protein Tco_1421066 [Tanacetum coccineum]
MGGIFSIEARDMDTKLLSDLESNNTLARDCLEGTKPGLSLLDLVASSGWPFASTVPGQMTHLVASLTPDNARSCVM